MQQVDPFKYQVSQGEKVTITVDSNGPSTPLAVAACVTAELTETASGARIQWSFKVKREPGEDHNVKLRFEFPPTAGDGDLYEVTTSGDDATVFDVDTIHVTDSDSLRIRYRRSAS